MPCIRPSGVKVKRPHWRTIEHCTGEREKLRQIMVALERALNCTYGQMRAKSYGSRNQHWIVMRSLRDFIETEFDEESFSSTESVEMISTLTKEEALKAKEEEVVALSILGEMQKENEKVKKDLKSYEPMIAPVICKMNDKPSQYDLNEKIIS